MNYLYILLAALIWPIGFITWLSYAQGEGEIKLTRQLATDGTLFFKYISPTLRKIQRHCYKDSTAQGEWFSIYGVIYRFKKRKI